MGFVCDLVSSIIIISLSSIEPWMSGEARDTAFGVEAGLSLQKSVCREVTDIPLSFRSDHRLPLASARPPAKYF